MGNHLISISLHNSSISIDYTAASLLHTVSQNVSVNSSQSGELQGNSTVRLSYTQPATDEGLTLQLCAHTGDLTLFVSTSVPNPSEALYDFVINVKAVPQYLACNATFFNFTLIAPDQEGRGTITLFLTLKGGSKLNNFTLNSDEGFVPGKSLQFLLILFVKV
jgi:hypothetical protein